MELFWQKMERRCQNLKRTTQILCLSQTSSVQMHAVYTCVIVQLSEPSLLTLHRTALKTLLEMFSSHGSMRIVSWSKTSQDGRPNQAKISFMTLNSSTNSRKTRASRTTLTHGSSQPTKIWSVSCDTKWIHTSCTTSWSLCSTSWKT